MGLTILAAVTLGGIWITSQVPLYTASTTLLIEPSQEFSENIDAEDAQDRYYQQQIDLLRSPEFAAQIVTSLDLESNPAFAAAQTKRIGLWRLGTWFFHRFQVLLTYSSYLVGATPSSHSSLSNPAKVSSENSSAIVARYLKLLTVTPNPYTYSTEVSFTTPDPVLSQELADAHATTFVRTAQKANFELTTDGRELLGKFLATQGDRLTQAEATLQQFRSEHVDVSPPSKDNLTAQRLLDTHQHLTNARALRIETETLYRLTERKETAQLATIIKSDRVNQLRATFTKVETEHTRLSAMLSPTHLRLSELSTAKNTARQRLEQELASIVINLEAEYIAALNTETILQKEVLLEGAVLSSSRGRRRRTLKRTTLKLKSPLTNTLREGKTMSSRA